jgi:histidinol phosphatase-like PHP family hydrolase
VIEFHTHTVFSDGTLLPAALARRARILDYQAVAFTDHADWTNYAWILEQQLQSLTHLGLFSGLDLIVGLELTHVPPSLIQEVANNARMAGAQVLLVHGETLADSVETGTNLAAIEAKVDILAHPGLITEEEASLAGQKGVLLEISARTGHCLTNGHLVQMARQCGADVILGSDVHTSADLPSREQRQCIALGAGMCLDEYIQAETRAQNLLHRVRSRR